MGVFSEGLLFSAPDIGLAIPCISDLSTGAFPAAIVITPPQILLSVPCISDLSTGAFTDAIVITPPQILLATVHQNITIPGVHPYGTELWFWTREQAGEPVNTVVVDPFFGVKTFRPAFEIVVGKLLDFVGEPLYGLSPLSVSFTDLCSPIITEWYWTFGDGGTSDAQNPVYVYRKKGTYTVRLRVKIGIAYYYVLKTNYIIVWDGGFKVPETSVCLRFAILPEQGSRWSFLGGPGWPFPEPRIGAFQITTDTDQPLQLVTNSRTRKNYVLATRNGPDGSNIYKRLVDGYGDAYVGSNEIGWYIDFKRISPDNLSHILKHIVSHFFVRPDDPRVGYRDAQQLSVSVFVDDELVARSSVEDIPINGDITFDRSDIQGRMLMVRLEGTASGIQVKGQRTEVELLPYRALPQDRELSFQQHQKEFSSPYAWFTRYYQPTMNKATGELATGSIYGTTTGPDGRANSAMVFAAASQLTTTLFGTLDADFSFVFWASSIFGTKVICQMSTANIQIVSVGGVYSIRYVDVDLNQYDAQLTWNGVGWVCIKVSRETGQIFFSENGALITSDILASVQTLGQTLILPSLNARSMFDFRVVPTRISEDAFAYYYGNVINDEGKAFIL